MRIQVTNNLDAAIGTGAGMLEPGESVELDVTPSELKAWEACEYADVQRVAGPEGSGDTETAEPAAPKKARK